MMDKFMSQESTQHFVRAAVAQTGYRGDELCRNNFVLYYLYINFNAIQRKWRKETKSVTSVFIHNHHSFSGFSQTCICACILHASFNVGRDLFFLFVMIQKHTTTDTYI